MQQNVRAPWGGLVNWQALRPYAQFLARRAGDRDEWLIGVAPSVAGSTEPQLQIGGSFGFLGYDLKNSFENLSSRHPEGDGFPLSHWFTPRFIIRLANGQATLKAKDQDLEEGKTLLHDLVANTISPAPIGPCTWLRTTTRENYLEQVRRLLNHIQRGDIYEVNYCTQRTATLSAFDPYAAFALLLAHSDAPFSAFLRHGDRFALCASPERYLRIEGQKIISQPMKGTRPRGSDETSDRALAEELAHDPKERSENIMALDVARNDLSRIAASGSVHVDELCVVKSYPNVHQMVSTVRAELRQGLSPMDIFRATFPMASMTGAPKLRAMQLIDGTEDMRRGLFSGAIGYFLPDGTADLNVVIRTVTWNAATGHASLISGGAITAASDPEQEFAECELKARSVLNAFGHAC